MFNIISKLTLSKGYARWPSSKSHSTMQSKRGYIHQVHYAHIDTHHQQHHLSLPFSSLPAFLTIPMNVSSPPKSHASLPAPPLQPSTPRTSSLPPYSFPSSAPNTATAVLMMTPSPSNTMMSHTLTAVSTPNPFPGPRKSVRIIGSSTSCAVRPRPAGAGSKRWAWRRGNL